MPQGHYDRMPPIAKAERDEAVRRMAFQEGMEATQIAATLGNITPSGVRRILDTRNDRLRVLMFLEKQDKPVGIRDIAYGLALDINKVMFIVENLKKRGHIDADELKSSAETGDHRHWGNIKVKKRQHGKIRGTNGAHHGPAPEAPPFVQERIPEQVTWKVVDDSLRDEDAADAEPELIDATDVHVTLVTPENIDAVFEALRQGQEAELYPIVTGLLNRDANLTAAAGLLESAGMIELAVQALDGRDQFTPLEREYMKYVRQAREARQEPQELREATNDEV